MTPDERAELRRLAEAATPGPWAQGDPTFGCANAQCVVSISDAAMGRDVMGPSLQPALFDVEWIAAANPAAVLALLDQLEGAEAVIEVQDAHARQILAERDALAAQVAAVRALHYPADNDAHSTPVCETCHGEAGIHECGCWSPEDRQPVCGHCNEGHKSMSVAWPCPTIRALGADA